MKDELKVTKRRLEALESSNASYAATIKLLQQERNELDKLNGNQEVEIEKLLNIVQRLHEKYDKTKVRRPSGSVAPKKLFQNIDGYRRSCTARTRSCLVASARWTSAEGSCRRPSWR